MVDLDPALAWPRTPYTGGTWNTPHSVSSCVSVQWKVSELQRQCSSNVWTYFMHILSSYPGTTASQLFQPITAELCTILWCDFMSKLNHSGNRIIPWGAGQQCSLCPRSVSPCCSIVVSGLGIRHDLSGYQGSRHCPPCPPWSDPNNKMEIIVLFSSNICQIFQTINNQLTLSTRGKEL